MQTGECEKGFRLVNDSTGIGFRDGLPKLNILSMPWEKEACKLILYRPKRLIHIIMSYDSLLLSSSPLSAVADSKIELLFEH